MKKEISNKITNINFILTMLVVLLHSNYMYLASNSVSSYSIASLINALVTGICHIGVPTFFCISSYLFFRNFHLSKYKEKLKSRVKSLVIPYFFWSIFFLIYVVVITNIVIKLNVPIQIELASIEYDFFSFLKYIVWETFDGPLWYIRNLFIFFLLSPLFYQAIIKLKKGNWIIILISLGLNLVFLPSSYGCLYWFPIFYLSAYLAIHHKEKIESEKINLAKWKAFILGLAAVFLILISLYPENETRLFFCYRMFIPLLVWLYCQKSKLLSKTPKNITKYSFLIYCVHMSNFYSITALIQKIFILLFGNHPIVILLLRFVTCFAVVLVIYGLAKIINKLFPRCTKIILGGRI